MKDFNVKYRVGGQNFKKVIKADSQQDALFALLKDLSSDGKKCSPDIKVSITNG
jgi:hypothetical protein